MTTTRIEQPTRDTRRTHMTTVVRAQGMPRGEIRLVISVDPFGPNGSAHLQRYTMHANGRLTLNSDAPYRTERAAVAAFDALHNTGD